MLSQIRCKMGTTRYEITTPTKWLQTIDPNLPYEILDMETMKTTTSNYEILVYSKYYEFSSVGL